MPFLLSSSQSRSTPPVFSFGPFSTSKAQSGVRGPEDHQVGGWRICPWGKAQWTGEFSLKKKALEKSSSSLPQYLWGDHWEDGSCLFIAVHDKEVREINWIVGEYNWMEAIVLSSWWWLTVDQNTQWACVVSTLWICQDLSRESSKQPCLIS